jgi:serine/threonine protein kinase/tetratricopeptide (TPR) repeat protein
MASDPHGRGTKRGAAGPAERRADELAGEAPLDPTRLEAPRLTAAETLAAASLHPRHPAAEGPGSVLGRYTLIEEIGSGGFGAVFLAEQREPVARRVALKVIKLGMDTRQVIARFEQERQALALMDHPNIARVFDAGTTDTGRPYFVMELVTGEPITTFSDRHRLTVEQRLELMTQVANAIQHAHLKGIIHRDIKPTNVLVSMHDGEPHAKIIDFGIAKAISQQLSAATIHTHLGQMVGTPLYMSPEQSEGSLDVDTRTDVYSLGVLLYELLTGTTPFDPAAFESSSPVEHLWIIRQVEPPRPSARFSSAATKRELAARRSAEPAKVVSKLRGELDWIVMKAMEKEPDRRYETASALAQDLRRFLAGEPVLAAPPSNTYRLRKFVSRHRGGVVAATLVGAALIAGLAGTLWQARVAARERDAAREEAARATALNDFMEQMLAASDPEAQGERDVTVRELLDKASETVNKTLAGQPEAEAEARGVLGRTFISLADNPEGIAELERAVALREQGPGRDSVSQATTLQALARAYRDKGDVEKALSIYERAAAILDAKGDDALAERATIHYHLARTRAQLSRFPEAERELDLADGLLDRMPEPRTLPNAKLSTRGLILSERADLARLRTNDLAEAERLSTESLDVLRRNGEPFLIADALGNLAVIKMHRGQRDEVIPLYEEAIALTREVYGDRHPHVAVRLENLGDVYRLQGKPDLTKALLEEVLAIREQAYGEDSPSVARTRVNMGVVALQEGDFARSADLIGSSLDVLRRQTGEQTLDYALVVFALGRAEAGLGNRVAARRRYEESLGIQDAVGTPTGELRLRTLQSMVELDCEEGSRAEADRVLDLALSALERDNAEHAKWIDTFEKLRAKCGARPVIDR